MIKLVGWNSGHTARYNEPCRSGDSIVRTLTAVNEWVENAVTSMHDALGKDPSSQEMKNLKHRFSGWNYRPSPSNGDLARAISLGMPHGALVMLRGYFVAGAGEDSRDSNCLQDQDFIVSSFHDLLHEFVESHKHIKAMGRPPWSILQESYHATRAFSKTVTGCQPQYKDRGMRTAVMGLEEMSKKFLYGLDLNRTANEAFGWGLDVGARIALSHLLGYPELNLEKI